MHVYVYWWLRGGDAYVRPPIRVADFLHLHFSFRLDPYASANPWARLLRRDFPSMADPSFVLSHDQHHQLFHRTAKIILSLRLVDANHETRRKRELRRLQEKFCDKSVCLEVHHPTHGLIAEASIPIARGDGVHFRGNDCTEREQSSKKLRVRPEFRTLPIVKMSTARFGGKCQEGWNYLPEGH